MSNKRTITFELTDAQAETLGENNLMGWFQHSPESTLFKYDESKTGTILERIENDGGHYYEMSDGSDGWIGHKIDCNPSWTDECNGCDPNYIEEETDTEREDREDYEYRMKESAERLGVDSQ